MFRTIKGKRCKSSLSQLRFQLDFLVDLYFKSTISRLSILSRRSDSFDCQLWSRETSHLLKERTDEPPQLSCLSLKSKMLMNHWRDLDSSLRRLITNTWCSSAHADKTLSIFSFSLLTVANVSKAEPRSSCSQRRLQTMQIRSTRAS